MLSIISTIVGLSVLILVHELGHFLAAKGVGIMVPRFSLGFGRRLAGFQWGETEFVLSAIPLGGYVKMAGMEDDEASSALEGAGPAAAEVDPARTFDGKPLWARTLVISAGVIMNLLFAWVVYAGLAFTHGTRETTEQRISAAGAAANPRAVQAGVHRIPEGARLVAVGDSTVRNWDEAARALMAVPAGAVELRFADAPPVTLRLPGDDTDRAKALVQLDAFVEPRIAGVKRGEPAYRAGLRAGDLVKTVDGAPVVSWQQMVASIQSHAGKPLALTVQRGGRTLAMTVTPDPKRESDLDGNRVTIGRIGAERPRPQGIDHRVGFGRSIVFGAQATWDSAKAIADVLRKLLTGQLSARNVGGILSIGEASGQTASLGLAVWLSFLALFSVNLAVLNLLPIPILDGGHLLFLAFEAVRGRPLSVEARIRLSQVGLVIVVALMIWANGNDVVRMIFNR